MTNEEKAYLLSREIAQEHDYKESASYDCAIAMAEWKEKQMIEKAEKWFMENGIDSEYFERLKQTMKGGGE